MLNDNPDLQSLPNELLSLPRSATVDLSRTGLSQQVLDNLQQISRADGYEGPRIFFSLEHMESREELKSLSTLLAELFSVLEEDPRPFPHLEQLDESQKDLIRSWLSRLSYIANYKREGEFEKAFAKKILGYLEAAENDEKFRQVFLNIIFDATETCGDRISLSVLHIGIACYLSRIPADNLQELHQFLIGTVWPVQMLEKIACEKIEGLRFVDVIEVYLAYPIKLRDRLGLKLDVQTMLYFPWSGLKQEDLDKAAEYVERQQQNEEAACAFLSQREDWREALEALYPERYNEIEKKNYQELEAAGKDQEKINQVGRNEQERWKTFTTWALLQAAKEEEGR